MNVYEKYLLPAARTWSTGQNVRGSSRLHRGPCSRWLEVGIGSGLNLPFYGPGVTSLYAVDPSVALWSLGRRRVKDARFPVEFLAASGERIPLEDATGDTAVKGQTRDVTILLTPDSKIVKFSRAPEPGKTGSSRSR